MPDHIVLITRSFAFQDNGKELSSTEIVDMTKSGHHRVSDSDLIDDGTETPEDDLSDQVPTLALHEKSPQNGSGTGSSNREGTTSVRAELHELPQPSDRNEVLRNGEIGSPASKIKSGGKGSSPSTTNRPFGFGQRNQDTSYQKVDFYNPLLVSSNNVLDKMSGNLLYWLMLKLVSVPAKTCMVWEFCFVNNSRPNFLVHRFTVWFMFNYFFMVSTISFSLNHTYYLVNQIGCLVGISLTTS